jgi:hypothetical protein
MLSTPIILSTPITRPSSTIYSTPITRPSSIILLVPITLLTLVA